MPPDATRLLRSGLRSLRRNLSRRLSEVSWCVEPTVFISMSFVSGTTPTLPGYPRLPHAVLGVAGRPRPGARRRDPWTAWADVVQSSHAQGSLKARGNRNPFSPGLSAPPRPTDRAKSRRVLRPLNQALEVTIAGPSFDDFPCEAGSRDGQHQARGATRSVPGEPLSVCLHDEAGKAARSSANNGLDVPVMFLDCRLSRA